MQTTRTLLVALSLVLLADAAQAAPPPAKGGPRVAAEAWKKCTALEPGLCAPLDRLIADGDAGQQAALALLDHEDPWLRRAGARVLVLAPLPEAAPKLAGLLADADPAVRAAALDALGMTGDRTQAGAVVTLAGSEKETVVRVAALRALGRLRATEGLPRLVDALADGNRHVVFAAVEALGAVGSPEGVIPLATLLADPRVSPEVQTAAAKALGRLRDARAVPNLMLATGHPEVEVRRQAVITLGILGATQAVDLLIERLSDEPILPEAVAALGAIDDPRTLEPLLTVLRAEDLPVDVRRAVLDALGRRKVADAVPELMTMLREGAGPLAVDTIRALGAIRDERAISRLIELLGSKDEAVVGAANSALQQITGQTLDPNPDYWNRWLTERGAEEEEEP